jgi:hypothetical protein
MQQSLESVLSKHGYVHSWKLLKQKSAIPALDRRATNDSTDALQTLLEHPVVSSEENKHVKPPSKKN